MLTKKQLKQLRSEITLNSLFFNDYSNTLYIKNKTACVFFDGYMEYIYDLATEEKHNNNLNVFDVIDEYDNIINLYNYYCDCCVNGCDPLLQDDFIASKSINNSDAIVIYNIENSYIYNCVLVAFCCLDGLCMKSTKIKKYKLYLSSKNGYYFKVNKIRYYINDFIKVNLIDRILEN